MIAPDYGSYQSWKGWSEKPFGVCSAEQALYFAAELRRSGVGTLQGKDVLEIGFGNGDFAAFARDAGAHYTGTEVIRELVSLGARAGLRTHHGSEPLQSLFGERSLDLIVSFDVFEHFDARALRDSLAFAFRALRPSGRLVARVPSGDSPFARAIQHGDSTHLTTLGSSMVHQLAGQAGFTVAAVREPALPLRGLGSKAFVRRAVILGLRTGAFAVMKRVFMGGGDPVLTPNMVFVLVKP